LLILRSLAFFRLSEILNFVEILSKFWAIFPVKSEQIRANWYVQILGASRHFSALLQTRPRVGILLLAKHEIVVVVLAECANVKRGAFQRGAGGSNFAEFGLFWFDVVRIDEDGFAVGLCHGWVWRGWDFKVCGIREGKEVFGWLACLVRLEEPWSLLEAAWRRDRIRVGGKILNRKKTASL